MRPSSFKRASIIRKFFFIITTIFIRIIFNQKPKDSFSQEFWKTLECLGPAYVKLGQILSLRNDLLPTSIVEELKTP